jgi:hypothetical protein
MRKLLGTILFLVGLILAAAMGNSVLWQHNAIHRFVPVAARIQRADLVRHSGKHVYYSPEATYTYDYQGQTYHSSRVLPYAESGDHAWADDIFQPLFLAQVQGRAVTAYVNPDDPAESILVRQYSFTPYVFTAAGILLAEIGIGILTRVLGGASTTMTAIALDDSGWQLLLPQRSLRRRFTDSLCWTLGAALATVPALFHYIQIAGQKNGIAIFWAIAIGVTLAILGFMTLRRWSLTRHVSDARLRIRPAPMKLAEPLEIDVEMDAFTPLRVKEFLAKLICQEHYRERRGTKTQTGVRVKGEFPLRLAADTQIPAGQTLAGKGQFVLEGPWPATSNAKVYPYYTWQISISAKLSGSPDYTSLFPLTVE